MIVYIIVQLILYSRANANDKLDRDKEDNT